MKKLSILALSYLFVVQLVAQDSQVISGPMQGATTAHSTIVWMMVAHADGVYVEDVSKRSDNAMNPEFLACELKPINDTLKVARIPLEQLGGREINDVQYELIHLDGTSVSGTFDLKLPSDGITDFSFMAGSCTFPYKLTNKHWNIFDKMLQYPSDFMLWMGDNIYLIRGDWNTKEKIYNRYIHYRSQPQLNAFLCNQPNFSAWDDHDFGPNNSGAEFEGKDMTLEAFKDFWANPSYGTDSLSGTFYNFTWQDVEFFILDGRYYKTDNEMYGQTQLEWLKAELSASEAKVKFIVGGCQFLVKSMGEDWGDYPEEKATFLNFLREQKMEGVVFLSGDRHLAELTVLNDGSHPKIVEVTSSPLTSFVNPGFFYKKKNPNRVKKTLVTARNFARLFLEGPIENRQLRIELRGKKGQLHWEYTIPVNELK